MPITLEDIENLSHEVQALVRAGLPLEGHLAEAGVGHGTRLQALTQSISDSLQSGRSLEEAVRNNQPGAPRMLAAAVAAGIHTGRLGETIEMLGDLAHDLVDLRRRILQSITYPITVVAVALLLFFVFIRHFLARVRLLFDDPEAVTSDWFVWLIDLDAEFWWWPLLFPVAGVICLLMWVLSRGATSLSFRGPERLMFLIPGVRGLVRDLHFYNLCRMLSLMVERQIPLTDALQLAGACSGNDNLDHACQTTAARLQQGDVPAVGRSDNWTPGQLPPMLLTCLRQAGQNEEQLGHRLSGVSGFYRRRLDISVSWLKNVIPIALFVVVGGGTVLTYSLMVFWPVLEVYRSVFPE
ncbi:MAG: type II secretion system F family protein [Planctomycetaceae bacterium]